MGGGVRHERGGILAVLTLIDEHREPIEFDLISLGLRLRDCPSPGFNWRDLWVICRRLGRSSELYKAMNPDDDTSWSVTDYLLALVADNTAFRLWQAAGGKGRKPKPIPRPGDTKKYGGDSLPVDQMADWLGEGWTTPSETIVTGLDLAERDTAIRSTLSRGESRAAVAESFGVSVSTVGRVARSEKRSEAPA